MTVTVGARSLDNEERSNFRDYMSLLSLSVDASMTVREVMAVAYLIGRRDALVLLQCLFDRFGSVFPQCGLMVFPGVVIVSR